MDILESKLDGFRKKRVTQFISFNERRLKFSVLGAENKDTILFLTGGSGIYEPFFEYMDYFSTQYKVIGLDYPSCETMAELTDIITSIIKAEAHDKIHIIGQSMGGMVAQVLMYKYPNLLNKVIMAHTATTSLELKDSNNESVQKKEKDINLINKFPQFLIRKITKSKIKKVIEKNNIANAEFWSDLFLENIGRRTKSELISPLYLMADFVKSYCFSKASFENISENVLIIDSKSDESFSDTEKAAVCSLFPNSKTVHFEDKPHLGLIAYPDEYISIIESFISD